MLHCHIISIGYTLLRLSNSTINDIVILFLIALSFGAYAIDSEADRAGNEGGGGGFIPRPRGGVMPVSSEIHKKVLHIGTRFSASLQKRQNVAQIG